MILEQVSLSYGKEVAVAPLSFSLSQGRNLCILGPNGSGKSTLLHGMAGLLPYQGSIQLSGRELSSLSPKERAQYVALLTQLQGQAFPYTVYETVLQGRYRFLPDSLFSNWKKEDQKAVQTELEQLGLWQLRHKKLNTLSGGQLQRVFLARTLVQNTSFILLDEPTNHLDLKHQAMLTTQLKAWSASTGGSVIGVFHDLNVALDLADDILLLHKGNLIAFGEKREIMTPALLERVYEFDVASYMLEQYARWQSLTAQKTPSL